MPSVERTPAAECMDPKETDQHESLRRDRARRRTDRLLSVISIMDKYTLPPHFMLVHFAREAKMQMVQQRTAARSMADFGLSPVSPRSNLRDEAGQYMHMLSIQQELHCNQTFLPVPQRSRSDLYSRPLDSARRKRNRVSHTADLVDQVAYLSFNSIFIPSEINTLSI